MPLANPAGTPALQQPPAVIPSPPVPAAAPDQAPAAPVAVVQAPVAVVPVPARAPVPAGAPVPARAPVAAPAPARSPAPAGVLPAPSAGPSVTGSSCDEGTHYLNSEGLCVPRPTAAAAPPPGATARCVDGEYSFSTHRQGTCSGHGGVAQWL
ncbi:MAG: DUF3761 domain-containing protein [Pseudonocardiales bacterium]|nr:DUF3761 domain-containing protein [Pseudonocardiales bacterium]